MFKSVLRWLLVVCLGLPSLAYAIEADEFVNARPNQQIKLLNNWAITPNLQRVTFLTALKEGKVGIDANKQAALKTTTGWQALTTESSVVTPVKALRLNNRLRGAVNTTFASHQLLMADTNQRLAAAHYLQRTAKADLLPLLTEQLAVEQDSSVKQALQLALANLQLADSDPQVRIAAVKLLGNTGDPLAKTRLENLLADPTETNPEVRKSAETSLHQINRQLTIGEYTGQAFMGLSLASILLLAALGLAITFGLLGVINMAHGEMLMLGAYTTYLVQRGVQQLAPELTNYYPIVALPIAFLVTACIGMVLERTVIRHLYGRPLETLLATWGISLILIQIVRLMFGAQNVEVANPAWLSGGLQVLPNLILPWNRIVIIGFALVVLAFVWLLLNKTRLGLNIRAVTQNRQMANCCGVATARVDMLAFGLGSGIAGLGGVALSQVGNVGPELGQGYIIDSFLVVVLGGVGQLAGTVWAAMGLGVINKILEPTTGAVMGKIIILALVIIFIQKRPQGLFALKGRVID